MSDVRAVTGSANDHLPPKPRDAPKRDGGKGLLPRRDRKPQATEAEISEAEPHQLNVSA
jgi:hypothetical protein